MNQTLINQTIEATRTANSLTNEVIYYTESRRTKKFRLLAESAIAANDHRMVLEKQLTSAERNVVWYAINPG